MEYVVIVLCFIIVIIVCCYFNIKNKIELFNLYNKKIDESIKSIDLFLEKKEVYLERAINIIKNSNKKKYAKKDIMESLIKNKNKKLDRASIYNELEVNLKELYELIEDDQKLSGVKKLDEVVYDIKNNESDLIASIKFYNSSIDELKKIRSSLLTNFIYKKMDFSNYQHIELIDKGSFAILKEGKK